MANRIRGTVKNSTSYKKDVAFTPIKIANPLASEHAKPNVTKQPSKKGYRGWKKRGGEDAISTKGLGDL